MRRGPLLSVGLFLLAACGQVPAAPTPEAAGWSSAWEGVPDRIWLGPAWWGNRLQDWRQEGGRLACVDVGGDPCFLGQELVSSCVLRARGIFYYYTQFFS